MGRSTRPLARARRRRPPVPFALALPAPGAPGPGGAALARLRGRRDRLADDLVLLDAACWRGELNARGLRRLQEVRREFAELDRRIAGREPGEP